MRGDQEAKRRQVEGAQKGGQASPNASQACGNIATSLPEPVQEKSRDQVAKLVGIGARSADKAVAYQLFAPDLSPIGPPLPLSACINHLGRYSVLESVCGRYSVGYDGRGFVLRGMSEAEFERALESEAE